MMNNFKGIMRLLLVASLVCLLPSIVSAAPNREGRQFGWLRDFFGGAKEPTPVSQRRAHLEDPNVGRRFGPVQPPPRTTNRRLAGPRGPTNYNPPQEKKLEENVLQKRLLMPVIISSYSSTNIQGQRKDGKDDDDILGNNNEPVQLQSELSIDNAPSTTTTTTTRRTTTTKSTTTTTTPENDVVLESQEEVQSPYFPSIPPTIDEEVPNEKYQLVVKDTSIEQNIPDTEGDCIKNKCKNKDESAQKKPSLKPKKPLLPPPPKIKPAPPQKPIQLPPRGVNLPPPPRGGPPPPPQGGRIPLPPPPPPQRGGQPTGQQQFKPNQPAEESSFFDFIPFWSRSSNTNKPIKNINQFQQAPQKKLPPHQLNKNIAAPVKQPEQPQPPPATTEKIEKTTETASEDTLEEKVDKEAIENEIDDTKSSSSTEPEPFIVTGDIVRPPPKVNVVQQPLNRGPPPPPGYNYPPKGQPLLRKPLHPPNRKQAPFVPPHNRPHLKPHPNHPPPPPSGKLPPPPPPAAGGNKTFPPPPPQLAKTKPFPPRLNPTSFRRQDLGNTVFAKDKPGQNGEDLSGADLASSLTSFLNSFFSTTTSPPPQPSLPTLVEDTEFSQFKKEPVRATTKAYKPTTSTTTTTTTTTTEKAGTDNDSTDEIDTNEITTEALIIDEELDTLSAPKPKVKPQQRPVQFNVRKPSKPHHLQKKPLPPPRKVLHHQKPEFRKQQPVLLQKPLNVQPPLPTQVLIGGPKAPLPPQGAFRPAPTPRPLPPPPSANRQQVPPQNFNLQRNVPVSTEAPRINPNPSTTLLTEITQTTSQKPVTTTTTLSQAIQEAVAEITHNKPAEAEPLNLPNTVLHTIKKNFEQKKNIFEQFVSIDAGDTPFLPAAEVRHSDWRIEQPQGLKTIASPNLARSASERPTTTLDPTTERSSLSPSSIVPPSVTESVYPNERNAEGGFKPMIKPLHSPLLE